MTEKHPAITLEYILLGLLKDQPDHGYALFERVQNTPELSLIWQVKRSKLYYLLEKLAKEGLLSFSVRSQEDYPDRKIYQLTPAGQQAFKAWMQEPVLISRYVRISFLSKLYFALQQSRDLAQKLIADQLEVCRDWLDSLADEIQGVPEVDFISTQVYAFRMGQVSAMIEWLENCRDQIPS